MTTVCYPPGLLGVDEVVARMLDSVVQAPAVEIVALKDLLGRVLAEDIVASVPVPPRANSAMDGIAFCYADANAKGPTTLFISQRLPAGAVPKPLLPGSVARIFTGAELPPRADSVLMQEHCQFEGDRVTFTRPAAPGGNIRPAGQDIAKGSFLAAVGQRLGPAHLGLMASVGESDVAVYKRLRVAVMCTGDELVDPGQTLPAGKIFNSNHFLLVGLLQRMGFEVLDIGNVPDNADLTRKALQQAVTGGADVILCCGGMSVGDEDHVRPAVESMGRIDFWKLAMKPGKPLAFGQVLGVPFVGLPGNPQAVWVGFLAVARPYLLRLQGVKHVQPEPVELAADFEWQKPHDRREYLRVKLMRDGAGWVLQPHENQSSGALFSAAWSDGLALVEAGATVARGDLLAFYSYEQLLAC